MNEDLQKILTQINPRRFEILLQAARLGSSFTAAQFREVFPLGSSSLTRDLNALEAAGLLLADPSMTQARQGQRVVYQVAPDISQRFQDLADVVAQAYAR